MTSASEPKPALLLAEYDTAADVVHAAEKVRDAGYKNWDTHTPFPIHGMDKAMGLKDSILGLIVFPVGVLGTTAAFTMMHWMNGIDYPLVIGGKPAGAPGTLPSMIPIMFELTVLFSAFAIVFGMFGLNKLPRHHHPIFNASDRFNRATDDKFFVSIEGEDPKFNLEKTKRLLESTHPVHIELVNHDAAEDGREEKLGFHTASCASSSASWFTSS
ncbi:DUF3341 domain-containing protein, partial [bacterium]